MPRFKPRCARARGTESPAGILSNFVLSRGGGAGGGSTPPLAERSARAHSPRGAQHGESIVPCASASMSMRCAFLPRALTAAATYLRSRALASSRCSARAALSSLAWTPCSARRATRCAWQAPPPFRISWPRSRLPRVTGGARTTHVRRVTLLLAGRTASRRARVRAAAVVLSGYVREKRRRLFLPPPSADERPV